MSQQRRSSQRRYLASLVSSSEDSDAASSAKPSTVNPFTVSLSYTVPKKGARSTLAIPEKHEAPPCSTEPERLVPQPPARRSTTLVPSIANPQLCNFRSTVARKQGVGMREAEYDGSEQSFLALLMGRLRQQCAGLFGGVDADDSYHPTSSAAPTDGLSSEDALMQKRTLWAAVEARNRPSLLRQVPVEVVLLILEFVSISDLCRLAPVSRRMSIITSSPVLWVSYCKRYRLSFERTGLSFIRQPKDIVCEYLVQTRAALDHRLRHEEQELEHLERRLNERAQQTAPFSNQFTGDALAQPQLSRLIEHTELQMSKMTQQAADMEAVRVELLRLAQTNRETLVRSQQQLDTMLRHVDPENRLGLGHGNASATLGKGSFSRGLNVDSSESVGNSAAVATVVAPIATALPGVCAMYVLDCKAVETFERRICRSILQFTPELPIVIRRGLSTFSALELLVLQLQGSAGDAGSRLSLLWKQFKQVFPVQRPEYYDLCDWLRGEGAGTTSGLPSKLEPCAALMRKLLSMNDTELVSFVRGE